MHTRTLERSMVMMKSVLVKSVHGAFGYVMEHYYPFGMAAEGVLLHTP